ncbi:MAG: phospholipase D-like domain-containing protein [Eubacteriales bacterium]|jgi:cardiolipin synthase
MKKIGNNSLDREAKNRLRFPHLRRLARRRIVIILMLLAQLFILILLLHDGTRKSRIAERILIVFSVACAYFVMGTDDKSDYKLSWVMIILTAKLFGGIFYLLFRLQSLEKPLRERDRQKSIKAAGYLSSAADTGESSAAADRPGYQAQINYLTRSVGYPMYKDSEVTWFPTGESLIESIFAEMEKAEKSLFVETFILSVSDLWDEIFELMKRKAAEGVDIRLIYDDIGSFLRLPTNDLEELQKIGVKVAAYHPFNPVWSMLQNNRDHRKMVIVDGKTAYTGGVNIGDEYINRLVRFGHWKDGGIKITGPAVDSFTVMFLRMFETIEGTDEDYSLFFGEHEKIDSKNLIIPYDDSPLDREQVSENVYLQIINGAQKYLYIETPYLILDDIMLTALQLSAKSGVDVRILTPHIPDKKFTFRVTRSYYRPLIDAGVRIFEYTPGFNHAKIIVSDDLTANVGTANFDYRSFYLMYECGVWMQGEIASEISRDFLETLKISEEITADNPIVSNTGLNLLLRPLCRILAPLL